MLCGGALRTAHNAQRRVARSRRVTCVQYCGGASRRGAAHAHTARAHAHARPCRTTAKQLAAINECTHTHIHMHKADAPHWHYAMIAAYTSEWQT